MEALNTYHIIPPKRHLLLFFFMSTEGFFCVCIFVYDEWLSISQICVSTMLKDLGPYLSRLSLIFLSKAVCCVVHVKCKSNFRLLARPSWILLVRESCLVSWTDITPVEERGLPACWHWIIYNGTKEAASEEPYRASCWKSFRLLFDICWHSRGALCSPDLWESTCSPIF